MWGGEAAMPCSCVAPCVLVCLCPSPLSVYDDFKTIKIKSMKYAGDYFLSLSLSHSIWKSNLRISFHQQTQPPLSSNFASLICFSFFFLATLADSDVVWFSSCRECEHITWTPLSLNLNFGMPQQQRKKIRNNRKKLISNFKRKRLVFFFFCLEWDAER